MKNFLINLYSWALYGIMIYVSGWLMFVKPLVEILSYTTVTGVMVVILLLKIMFALPVARIIYYVGLIIALKIFFK